MEIRDQRWQELDERLDELTGGVDLDNHLAPSNRKAEYGRWREAFDDGRRYEPQFEFDPVPEVREPELRALLSELDEADPMEAIYAEAIRLRLGEIEMCRTRDGAVISRETIRTYGRPDEALLERSRRNLAELSPEDPALEGRLLGIDEIAAICRKSMEEYGFDFKVVVKGEMGCKAAVDNLLREFWIRSDVVWPEGAMKMVVVHEIGTHILRTDNGYAQPLGIFGRGLPAYQLTEEGLAEYTELKTGCLHDDTIRRISARVIGVEIALRGSFCDVSEAVEPHLDAEMAFDVAQRAKLGQADTSKPGSYTKDYAYLEGFYRMERWFDAVPAKADLDALLAGKVGFQHLETVKTYQAAGYLRGPKAYPEWMGPIPHPE